MFSRWDFEPVNLAYQSVAWLINIQAKKGPTYRSTFHMSLGEIQSHPWRNSIHNTSKVWYGSYVISKCTGMQAHFKGMPFSKCSKCCNLSFPPSLGCFVTPWALPIWLGHHILCCFGWIGDHLRDGVATLQRDAHLIQLGNRSSIRFDFLSAVDRKVGSSWEGYGKVWGAFSWWCLANFSGRLDLEHRIISWTNAHTALQITEPQYVVF